MGQNKLLKRISQSFSGYTEPAAPAPTPKPKKERGDVTSVYDLAFAALDDAATAAVERTQSECRSITAEAIALQRTMTPVPVDHTKE